MSNVKISELPAASGANAGDELPTNQSGTTRKLTRAQIVAGLATSGAITSSGLTMATARILGRTTASTGAVEELSAGTGISISGGTIAATNNGTVTSIVAGTGLTGGTITTSGTVAADVATDTNIRAGTADKLVASAGLYSAAAPVTLTDGATITPDFQAGRVFTVTLAGNRVLANPTNQVAGQSGMIVVSQDATGSRTLSYGNAWKFPGGAPTLTTTASAVDIISYYVQASGTIRATISKAFA
jgi:hypothetical protein